MSEPRVQIVIPFRDRGIDPRRAANLEVVRAWWYAHGFEAYTITDGLSGDAQFNRHRAYNRAVSKFPETDVYVFTEADMLIHPSQVWEAARLAYAQRGLVVPFTQYRYLSDQTTEMTRTQFFDHPKEDTARWWSLDPGNPISVFGLNPESTMDNGRSIGAVNVVSRETLNITGGFTEATSGNWYDDNIIEEAFAFLTGSKTRWVDGPAVHLYHLPGWIGDHLTAEDRQATALNRRILDAMRGDIRHRNYREVKQLMEVRR
jgi:hypothetical protein